MVDLLKLQPNKISRDLTDYVVGIYGTPGVGKTTIAGKFPKSLILAFEKGYLALPGVLAQDINNWKDFKAALKQLKDDKVKEMFNFVFIDTADIAWYECEKYICKREGVEKIGDIPYGGGYRMTEDEFFDTLKSIIGEGYGLGWLSHSELKNIKHEGLEEFQKITTTLPNKARKVLFGMSDMVIYARSSVNETTGKEDRVAYVRSNSKHEAKSRFKYMNEEFTFDYETLEKEFHKAIDLEESQGNGVVNKVEHNRYEVLSEDKLTSLIDDIKELAKNKRAEGVKVSDIKAILTVDPTTITSVDEAERILSELKNLK